MFQKEVVSQKNTATFGFYLQLLLHLGVVQVSKYKKQEHIFITSSNFCTVSSNNEVLKSTFFFACLISSIHTHSHTHIRDQGGDYGVVYMQCYFCGNRL